MQSYVGRLGEEEHTGHDHLYTAVLEEVLYLKAPFSSVGMKLSSASCQIQSNILNISMLYLAFIVEAESEAILAIVEKVVVP